MAFHETTALRLTVTIADIEPPIRRRMIVPRTLNFAELHEVIQAAFGWTDSLLHRYIVGGLIVGAPEFDEDGLDERLTLSGACSTRTSPSMACARCGGSSCVKASPSPAARWRG